MYFFQIITEKEWIKRASSSQKYACKLEGFSLHFYPSTGRFKFAPGKGSKQFSESKKQKF